MKILKKNLKDNEITVKIESFDDLWYLSQIIVPESLISGKTYRKINVSDKESERKNIFIEMLVQKAEFQEFSNVLKVLGKIMRSSDDRVQKGEYHSFSLSANDEIAIIKEWSAIDFDYLDKSCKKDSNLMLVAADYGDAQIAYYHNYSIEYSTTLSEELGGKRELSSFEKNKSEFIKTLLSAINELARNRKVKAVLIGATMSLIDALKSKINEYDYLKNKSGFAKINYSNRNGIKELINSGEAQKSIEKTQYYEQQVIINKLLELISKSKKSTYGYKFVKDAINKGAVQDLIVSTNFIKKAKENNFFRELDDLIKSSNESNATLSIINSNSEIGEQIDNLTGIAAILRYD
jgi:mRNA surveillance protein pelota